MSHIEAQQMFHSHRAIAELRLNFDLFLDVSVSITKWVCKEWPSIAVHVELRAKIQNIWCIASRLSVAHSLDFLQFSCYKMLRALVFSMKTNLLTLSVIRAFI